MRGEGIASNILTDRLARLLDAGLLIKRRAKDRRRYAWTEKYKANIVDLGGQLKPGGKVLITGGVKDGPYTEAKEVVGGFMVIAAENYDRVVEVARGCPGIVRPGASVEIREILTS